MQNLIPTPLATPLHSISDRSSEIKLLVLDIDGTISGVNNEIQEPVKQAIKAAQAKGVQVAIATGRMFRSSLRFHEEVGSTLPLIAYQGAWIQDTVTLQVHRHWPVSIPTALQLLEHFEQDGLRDLLSVHFYVNDQLYIREMTPVTQAYCERSEVEPIAIGDLRQVLTDEPTKVLALSDDCDIIEHLLGSLRQRYTPAELYLTKSVATFFEAANPFVNKGVAVRYLAEEMLGLQAANVMAIGDNFNDVEMLEYAGIGVAMGNGPADVQAIADWVAPSIELNGVAAAIENFLL
ncbi:MAG: Cof-type HAD-IIB family hydrolase [Leptolyngbyaceae bacterium]|nr:Cof-type HAD-IIB family hydrolase [Leptolyngbyaceae bacterium]